MREPRAPSHVISCVRSSVKCNCHREWWGGVGCLKRWWYDVSRLTRLRIYLVAIIGEGRACEVQLKLDEIILLKPTFRMLLNTSLLRYEGISCVINLTPLLEWGARK